jgi:hypothetical protein
MRISKEYIKKLIKETHKRLLEESLNLNKPLIVVDVQPEYEENFTFDLEDIINELNNYEGNIYYFFNGPEMGMVDEEELGDWLLDNGLDEDILYDIVFIEKEYAFIRDVMDEGYSQGDIISVLEYMLDNDISSLTYYDDYEEVINELEDELEDTDWIEEVSNGDLRFSLPECIEEIKSLPESGIIVGGGKDECLLEIELVLEALEALNKKYIRNDEFVY